MLKPTMFTVLTLGLIGSWQVFDQIYLTGGGRPGKTLLTPGILFDTAEALDLSAGPSDKPFKVTVARVLELRRDAQAAIATDLWRVAQGTLTRPAALADGGSAVMVNCVKMIAHAFPRTGDMRVERERADDALGVDPRLGRGHHQGRHGRRRTDVVQPAAYPGLVQSWRGSRVEAIRRFR